MGFIDPRHRVSYNGLKTVRRNRWFFRLIRLWQGQREDKTLHQHSLTSATASCGGHCPGDWLEWHLAILKIPFSSFIFFKSSKKTSQSLFSPSLLPHVDCVQVSSFPQATLCWSSLLTTTWSPPSLARNSGGRGWRARLVTAILISIICVYNIITSGRLNSMLFSSSNVNMTY